MAFTSGIADGSTTGAAGASEGPALPEIQTEGLGFLSLAGDAKLRLTSSWSPAPATNASLISIASRKGLVAAAGPDAIVLASTESIRKAFEGPNDGDSEVRTFEPQLKLPLPIRVCQLAFTADESFLLLSAEQGGGLAIYDVGTLQQGSTQIAFELPTNGESLRALVPNPRPEKAELCAVVTSEGKLLMANMKERNFVPGRNGQILKEQVSCVAWSNKGKQLVAGLADGTINQMTPEGDVKAEIPRPPDLTPGYYVSLLMWLENDVFLVFHVSTSKGSPETNCHLITRQGQNFQYQKFADPVDPYVADRAPCHTAVRLKDFPPNLQDLLIFSSTAIPDIGILARSKAPLSDAPSNTFANVLLADDSRRAMLPMGDGLDSPAAIGAALDLSGRDSVYKPIPSDELDQSPGPLPGYWVLNDQGVLSVWWVVYSESIRGGTTYPGLAVAEGDQATSAAPIASQPAQTNPFASPSNSTFGASPAPAVSAFGSTSTLGLKSSPWATQSASPGSMVRPAFGSTAFGSGAAPSAPVFGAPSLGTSGSPAFGSAPGKGAGSSPWGSNSTATNTRAFAQSGFATYSSGSGGGPNPSPFSYNNNANSSGGFSEFANKGGFASLGSNSSSNGQSIFASKTNTTEVSMDTDTSFPRASSKPGTNTGNIFGSQPFKLTSSFQPDPSASDQDDSNIKDKPPTGGKSLFSLGFASDMTDSAEPARSNPFATGSQSMFGQLAPSSSAQSTTPTSTPAPSKFLSNTPSAPKSGSILSFPSKSSGGLFGSSSSQVPRTESPQAKVEPETPKPVEEIPEPPLPPLSTSKITYPLGDSSSSSATTSADTTEIKNTAFEAEDIPLPPEPTPKQTDGETARSSPTSSAGDAPLPPDPVKDKSAYSAPLPPLPTTSAKPQAPNDAPLPPDPTTNKQVYARGPPPLPAGVTKPQPPSDAPLPPDPVANKTAYAGRLPPLPVAASQRKPSSDAPLPPDPHINKKAYAGGLPPLPGVTSTSKSAVEAPLPPDPAKQPKVYKNKLPALPIAKPASSTIGPGFKFPTNLSPASLDSDDDDLTEENEGSEAASEAASEGSGVDVARELSPSIAGLNKTPGYTPQSSFDGLPGSYSTVSRPDQDRRSLFGELGRNAPILPQPNPVSPRSPSPIRGAVPSRMTGKEQPRSVSAPGMASQILGASRRPQSRLGASNASRGAAFENVISEQQRKAKAKKEAQETQVLVDEEDDAIQELLQTQTEPTLDLDEFIGHTETPPATADSVPAQVEAVYRDINAMIDTLGLNARSLAAFLRGHEEFASPDHTRGDLAAPGDWTLGEIEDVTSIVDQDLAEALDASRVIDVEEKLGQISGVQRELVRDRNKQADLRKIIASRVDPEQTIANRALPLSAEQAAQQNDVRRELAKFMKLLAEAEESLTMLKAKVVSADSANGKCGPAPTVEAIIRTIARMTSAIEKRSGDIDVLENKMRKLRLGSAGRSPGSREGSPFATPNSKRMSSSVVRFTPDRSMREGSTPSRGGSSSVMRHSLSASVSSVGGFRTLPRKKLSGFGDADKKAVKEKRERRVAVLGKLRGSLQKKGVTVWDMEEID